MGSDGVGRKRAGQGHGAAVEQEGVDDDGAGRETFSLLLVAK